MKVAKVLKVIDAGWVRKKKGYRVIFESRTGETRTVDTMPGKEEAPLASEVAAWRSAWKMAQAGAPGNPELPGATLCNITVVDDEGTPVRYYATGRYKIYHRQEA
ncbi:MAG: hypothetical protein ABIL58_22480 [Pseudomonadota bacterium]